MQTCHVIWTFIGRNARYRHLPLSQIPPTILTERSNLQRWIKAWRAAFKAYKTRASIPDTCLIAQTSHTASPALNTRIVDAINTLIIGSNYFVIKSMLVEALPSPTARPWDLIAEKFLHCGSQALFLRQERRRMNSLATRKTFSAHVGIAESLMCLSHRTTSPAVTGRAQRLMAGFRDASGDLTGVSAFFEGYGAPPKGLMLVYERPGH